MLKSCASSVIAAILAVLPAIQPLHAAGAGGFGRHKTASSKQNSSGVSKVPSLGAQRIGRNASLGIQTGIAPKQNTAVAGLTSELRTDPNSAAANNSETSAARSETHIQDGEDSSLENSADPTAEIQSSGPDDPQEKQTQPPSAGAQLQQMAPAHTADSQNSGQAGNQTSDAKPSDSPAGNISQSINAGKIQFDGDTERDALNSNPAPASVIPGNATPQRSTLFHSMQLVGAASERESLPVSVGKVNGYDFPGAEEWRDRTFDSSEKALTELPRATRVKNAIWLALTYGSILLAGGILATQLGILPVLFSSALIASIYAVIRLITNNRLQEESKGGVLERNERWTPVIDNYSQLLKNLGIAEETAPLLRLNPDEKGSIAGASETPSSGAAYIWLRETFSELPEHVRAGILAHEIAHILLGHTSGLKYKAVISHAFTLSGFGATFSVLFHILFNITHLLAEPLTLISTIAISISLAAITLTLGHFSGKAMLRENERQADYLATQWAGNGMAAYTRHKHEEGLIHDKPRNNVARLWNKLRTGHPSDEERYKNNLRAYVAGKRQTNPPESLEPIENEYALNGTIEIQIKGDPQAVLTSIHDILGEEFELSRTIWSDEARRMIIRIHPKTGLILAQNEFPGSAMELRERFTQTFGDSHVTTMEAKPHDVFSLLHRSGVARRYIGFLRRNPIPIKWDPGLGTVHGEFRILHDGRLEIAVNPLIFSPALPKSLLALLAQEAFHYWIYRKFQEIGVPWLKQGGLEFEALAQSVGLRVWATLEGNPGPWAGDIFRPTSDDIAPENNKESYRWRMGQWYWSRQDEHLAYLRSHGYDHLARLTTILGTDPAAIIASEGLDEAPQELEKKLERVRALYAQETSAEFDWRVNRAIAIGVGQSGDGIRGPRLQTVYEVLDSKTLRPQDAVVNASVVNIADALRANHPLAETLSLPMFVRLSDGRIVPTAYREGETASVTIHIDARGEYIRVTSTPEDAAISSEGQVIINIRKALMVAGWNWATTRKNALIDLERFPNEPPIVRNPDFRVSHPDCDAGCLNRVNLRFRNEVLAMARQDWWRDISQDMVFRGDDFIGLSSDLREGQVTDSGYYLGVTASPRVGDSTGGALRYAGQKAPPIFLLIPKRYFDNHPESTNGAVQLAIRKIPVQSVLAILPGFDRPIPYDRIRREGYAFPEEYMD